MNHDDKLILVTGATGQQGGATARRLLAQGWRVRALTRDPDKAAAQTLSEQGAEVVAGDFAEHASLGRALAGAYGVFSVQNFWLTGVGPEGEIRQGKALAEAAKEAGVAHVVYTSVGGAERQTGIPHFESKWQIERHIRALGLPATILRPVAFMDNYFWNREVITAGTFTGFGLRDDKTLQLIAADDIGAFAALAFGKPEAFLGQALEIAGDELTEPDIAATFSRVLGRPVERPGLTGSPQEANPEALKMIRWFDSQGYQADIPALRTLYPELLTLEGWLHRTGWGQIAAPAA